MLLARARFAAVLPILRSTSPLALPIVLRSAAIFAMDPEQVDGDNPSEV